MHIESEDIGILEEYVDIKSSSIDRILTKIYLFDYMVYENEFYEFGSFIDYVPIGTNEQIMFMIGLCDTIKNNHGKYFIHIDVIMKDPILH